MSSANKLFFSRIARLLIADMTNELLRRITGDFIAPDMWPPNSPEWIMPFGLSFSNVCLRSEFMTLMSCDSVYCMCGAAWSSRWLMMQLTNGQHAYVLVFMPEVDILNILCDYQFVFSVLDELCASLHVDIAGNVLRVHYKSMKCDV